MKETIQRVAPVVVTLMFALSAQDVKPTCNHCSATYIPTDELQAYVQRAIANGLVDQQVRSVDIGRSQIGIGVVHRGKLDAPAPNSVAEHDLISEVYYVIDGSATLETGPDIVGMKRRPSTLQTVREYNGPGNNGSSITKGVTYHLKPGDVIVVPAGVGHLFTKIDDHITYLMVRIDPDKAVPLKDEAASKAYLRSDPKASAREK
ncbi:MAG TPA: AraC family ligand binding domain-containing protein [Bryobacteraceae bacterium]|nr:AraC family ligand binding domain-containing protein [Bryobacteraceae bacterium]